MFERRLPKEVRARESTLVPWGEFESDAVLNLLRLLARAFRWTEEDVQRLRPDDKLWAIYHGYYPQSRWWQRLKPDELEMETLLRDLEREAPGRDVELRPEVTLGELVRLLTHSRR
jgi:hypothetical protein